MLNEEKLHPENKPFKILLPSYSSSKDVMLSPTKKKIHVTAKCNGSGQVVYQTKNIAREIKQAH